MWNFATSCTADQIKVTTLYWAHVGSYIGYGGDYVLLNNNELHAMRL